MVSSIQQRVKEGIELVSGEIDFLAREENAQRDTSPFLRFASETIGGSSAQTHEAFIHDAAVARGFAMRADNALGEKNNPRAEFLLGEAKRWLATARSAFLKFHKREAFAASRAETALTVVQNAGLSFGLLGRGALLVHAGAGVALGLGVSVGLHAGFLSIISTSHSSNEEEVKSTPASAPAATDDTKPKPPAPNPSEAWVDEAIAESVTASDSNHTALKKEELITQARLALEEWKKNPAVHHHYGHFLIDADALEKQNSRPIGWQAILHAQWNKKLEEYRKKLSSIEDPKIKLGTLMNFLFRDYIGLYQSGLAGFDDILSGTGGNCEARMKLILAAISDLDMVLPTGTRLAIQPFADHIQLVLYNTKTGDIFDFMTRQSSRETPVNLYDPHIVFDAFLKGQGVPSGMDIEKFVIAKVNSSQKPGKSHLTNATNTRFRFPSADVYFGSSTPPQSAYTHSPYDTASDLAKSDKAVALVDITDPKLLREITVEMERTRLDFYRNEWNNYFFREKSTADYFNGLSSPKEKMEFLTRLSLQSFAHYSEDKDLQILFDILSDPKLLERHSESQIKRSLEAFFVLEETLSTCSYALGGFRRGNLDWSKKIDLSELTLRTRSPVWQLFEAKRKLFRTRIAKHPLAFVLFANRLSHEKRRYFLDMIGKFGFFDGTYKRNEAKRNVEAVIRNKNLLGIGNAPNGAPEFIEVTVGGQGKPLAVERETKKEIKSPTKKGKKTENDFFDDSNAPYRISFETFLDIVFRYDLVGRWSPRISKAFLEYNRDRIYDYMFSNGYQAVVDSYPNNLKTVRYDFKGGTLAVTKGEIEYLPPDIAHIFDVIHERHPERFHDDLKNQPKLPPLKRG